MISKLLALRLSKVLRSVTTSCQSVFFPGRCILDGVVMANELVELVKRSKKGCFMFKMDFEKAYDSVSWAFLDCMMNHLGFDDTWRK